ncbi:10413_t:CDS:2, partial [Scutellospora calospora]
LQILKNIRESQIRQYSIKPINQNLIKRANQYSESTLNRCTKNIAAMFKDEFIQSSIIKYHNQDSISLKLFKYTVDNQTYYFSFGNNLTQKITKDILIQLVDIDKAINNLEIIESDNADDDNIDFNKVLNSISTGRQYD